MSGSVVAFPGVDQSQMFEVVVQVDNGPYAREITLQATLAEINGQIIRVGAWIPFEHYGVTFHGIVLSIAPVVRVREGGAA